ncbi:hypothetical protein DPMN_001897 [Dreissena polymorpha]|uniref:Uncharacterized protein n=1 Tax=Dreissena polymorpha TaxID=45954 RepID=A0A9D4MI43_DREPO|nr:hypothetical protein DPMN_001897 [Dreissena polymorpha]
MMCSSCQPQNRSRRSTGYLSPYPEHRESLAPYNELKRVQNAALSKMEEQFGVLKKSMQEVHQLLPQHDDSEEMITARSHLCEEEEASLYSSNLHLYTVAVSVILYSFPVKKT